MGCRRVQQTEFSDQCPHGNGHRKPTFRDAFGAALFIAATGWYEWSAPRQRHIQLRDGDLMGFGGLLFTRGGKTHFVVMTSAADGELRAIHHRQPGPARSSWHGWLTGDGRTAEQYLQVAPTCQFNWYRVGPAVGDDRGSPPTGDAIGRG